MLVALVAGACTGSDSPDATATTTTTARPVPAPTIVVDPALPAAEAERPIGDRALWHVRSFVAVDGPAPRYCVTFTLKHNFTTADRTACDLKHDLDMLAGPSIDVFGAVFGVVAHDAVRLRVYDKDRNVVDVNADTIGRFPYRTWVAIVPAEYRPERVTAFSVDGKALRSAPLRALPGG